MPISVTCACGARLEIDEKFLGKEIACPDCQRPLPTTAPATPPPLDLPDNRRISGLAALSLTFALVGAFTIVGTLAAMALGWLALKRIARQPGKLEGAVLAKAGIITGALLTLITVAALCSPSVFGVDQFLREMITARYLTYAPGDKVETDDVEIRHPPGAWANYKTPLTPSEIAGNRFILYNTRADAYIGCQFVAAGAGDEKIDDLEKRVLEQVFKSELIVRAGLLGKHGFTGPHTESNRKAVGQNAHEVTVDLRLADIPRRLLIRFTRPQIVGGEQPRSVVLVACARANWFASLEDDFRKSFDSLKTK